jgi:cell pole-organizing protein PopZ
MTYRIEIAADSLAELAGRVAALAAQLQAQQIPVIVHHVGKAPRKAAPVAEPVALVAEPVALVAEPAALVAEPVALVAEPAVAAAVEYDLIADVNPRILAYVKRHSREAVEAILAQFGAARASEVPVEHHGELVAILDAAINA